MWTLTAPSDAGHPHRSRCKLERHRDEPGSGRRHARCRWSTRRSRTTRPKHATRITLPCGINGRIGQKRDLDHFVFTATKGKAIRLEVFARRFGTALRSQLDSQLDVMTPTASMLASNDDLHGKDAGLVFTPPADGDYVVRVRDLNNKGGDGFVYYLECDFARPDFTLKCDPSKAMIGPGSRTAWYVQVTRANGFAGPVKVEVQGLARGRDGQPADHPGQHDAGLARGVGRGGRDRSMRRP